MFAKIGLILLCATTKLSVLCAPTFTSWPQGVSSYRGGSAILKWTLSEAVSADWYSVVLTYNEASISTFKRNKLYYAEGYDESKVVADIKVGSADISLTLKGIQPENVINHYTCKIYITATSSVSNTQGWLLMYDTPADLEISSSPPDIIENRDLTMICSARSTTALPSDVPNDQRPIINYTWQRDSRDLTNDDRHRVGGEANNTLTIDKVQKEDHQATYTCIAQETGSELRNSKDIQLDVKYGPSNINIVPLDNVTKVENDSLTLTCAATCNPPCQYTWTKDSLLLISNSDKLQFASIRRQDQGRYVCRASNGIGNDLEKVVSIQVDYPPKIAITVTPSGKLLQGSEMTLMCIVDSSPSPSSITWTNITEAGLSDLDSSQNNDTHGWSILSDVDILDSGTYQCTADNGIRGSPVSVSKVITVEGPARWFKTDPLDLVNGVSIGDTGYFKVWIIARPLPTPNQWQWKFSPSYSSSTGNTVSGHVALSVSGNLAVLSISNVTVNDYGDYYIWTQNSYGGWNEGDLKFSLVPQGRPSKPDFFQATHVAAVNIKVQWTTGFNGGLSQTFTIRYTNLLSGVLFEKSAIEDTGLGSGQTITEYLTAGIEPKSKYQLQIFAVNAKGETAGDTLKVLTPALAQFLKDPEIKIDGVQSQIHFIISGPLTHIEVENCAEETDKCLAENVTVPQKTRRKRQSVEVLYDFISNVTLADPEARKFVFSFWIYDSEFQLASMEILINFDKLANLLGAIVGSLFGMVVVIMIIIILVVLSRKGLLKKKPGVIQDKRNTNNSQGISHQMSELTENEEPQYEIPRSTARQLSKEPSEYQSLLQSKLHIYTPASIKCNSMLCHSDFYEIWRGSLSENRNSSLQIVIKTVKDYNEVHKQYLHSQGENLIKLRSKDSIVACLGMTSDHKHLILEDAPLGNLKQYLQGKASETYYNVNDDNSSSNFIQQIIEGVEAVHELRPPALFYCLCASNVLVFSGQKCKVTGFASVETVKAREKWEDENRFQRPFQWLSPEAINLNHVMQSDIWSLGILMWEIFSQGKLPFGDISSGEAKQKILSGQKPAKPVKCSDDVYDLMARCWMRQPSNRPSTDDVKLQYTELIQYESV